MIRKITRKIIESHLKCQTKAHLKLAGQQGGQADYEALLTSNRQSVRQTAIGKILARHPNDEVARNISLTTASLEAGPSFVLDTTLENDLLSLNFDGIMRVDGASKLGSFHYVPVLYDEKEKLHQEQRLLLAVLGSVLGDVQGRQPKLGIVYLGDRCRGTKVRLTGQLQDRARTILREITALGRDGKAPKLMLNSHCQACEFRDLCRRQAEQEDDLSLLSGMGQKELRKHNRKGIFTIAQLSCTFRLRKRGKRVKRMNQPHYFALQAAAIRDRKTYVLKPPSLAISPVRIYFDIEGNTEKSFVYLLGMLIDERGVETRHSLWADTRDDEQAIFGRMLEIISQYDDFTLIHYGSYESYFLRRMRKAFDGNPILEKVIGRAVNLLPIISSHIYFPVYSNGLKSIGRHLGCEWTAPDASGLKSIVTRNRWQNSHDERFKQELECYNLEDCMALKRVAETVFTICEEVAKEKGEPEIALGRCVVARAEDYSGPRKLDHRLSYSGGSAKGV
jgi:predicted RecB family nuclease